MNCRCLLSIQSTVLKQKIVELSKIKQKYDEILHIKSSFRFPQTILDLFIESNDFYWRKSHLLEYQSHIWNSYLIRDGYFIQKYSFN